MTFCSGLSLYGDSITSGNQRSLVQITVAQRSVVQTLSLSSVLPTPGEYLILSNHLGRTAISVTVVYFCFNYQSRNRNYESVKVVTRQTTV